MGFHRIAPSQHGLILNRCLQSISSCYSVDGLARQIIGYFSVEYWLALIHGRGLFVKFIRLKRDVGIKRQVCLRFSSSTDPVPAFLRTSRDWREIGHNHQGHNLPGFSCPVIYNGRCSPYPGSGIPTSRWRIKEGPRLNPTNSKSATIVHND